jgi:hypothetical protein
LKLGRVGARIDMKTGAAFLTLCVTSVLLVAGLSACGTSGGEDGENQRLPDTLASGTAEATEGEGELVQPTPDLSGEPVNFMAVDADPESSDVDEVSTQPVGAAFDVAVNVTSVNEGYHVYQYALEWDSEILDFVSGEHLSPDAFTICFGFNPSDGGVSSTCGRSGGGSTHVGPLDTIRLRCKKEGTTALHLATLQDDPVFGVATFSPDGALVLTGTTDATVTCQ